MGMIIFTIAWIVIVAVAIIWRCNEASRVRRRAWNSYVIGENRHFWMRYKRSPWRRRVIPPYRMEHAAMMCSGMFWRAFFFYDPALSLTKRERLLFGFDTVKRHAWHGYYFHRRFPWKRQHAATCRMGALSARHLANGYGTFLHYRKAQSGSNKPPPFV